MVLTPGEFVENKYTLSNGEFTITNKRVILHRKGIISEDFKDIHLKDIETIDYRCRTPIIVIVLGVIIILFGIFTSASISNKGNIATIQGLLFGLLPIAIGGIILLVGLFRGTKVVVIRGVGATSAIEVKNVAMELVQDIRAAQDKFLSPSPSEK